MSNRIFRCGEPDTYVVCNRNFAADGSLVARSGQVVTESVFEQLRQDFSMEEILAGVKVENTVTLRKAH